MYPLKKGKFEQQAHVGIPEDFSIETDRSLGQSPRYLEAISVPSAASVCSDLLFAFAFLCASVSPW